MYTSQNEKGIENSAINYEAVTPLDIFSWGVDYGQLLMEEERDSEDWFDAFNCYFVARKTAMPSNPTPRRQPHSEKWRAAKRKGWENFKEYCFKYYGGI